ncbi:MAG: hypothetical protein L6R35_005325 [Caloplaca aegaea]|nr:MAG: hypothetical protein L6R35_005325 [Caloplaca aegaea]
MTSPNKNVREHLLIGPLGEPASLQQIGGLRSLIHGEGFKKPPLRRRRLGVGNEEGLWRGVPRKEEAPLAELHVTSTLAPGFLDILPTPPKQILYHLCRERLSEVEGRVGRMGGLAGCLKWLEDSELEHEQW